MPRPLRIHVPGGFYHVTLRGNHRRDIFFTPGDRKLLNDIVAQVIQRFAARVHAYCWMTNHVHLLVQVSELPLGRIMSRIASQYARTVQGRFQTTGHLFERRYHCILVDADAYLLELLRYIHLNPVRAGMAASVADYEWSSHRAYIGRRDEPWITTDFALSMFHRERNRAIVSYQRFVAGPGMSETRSPLIEVNRNDPRILGDDRFLGRILGPASQRRPGRTLEDLIEECCKKFSVGIDELRGPGKRRQLVRARAWIASQAQPIASIAAIARALNRDESTIRHALLAHGASTS